jgi:NAD(P)H-hydrate epimerase
MNRSRSYLAITAIATFSALSSQIYFRKNQSRIRLASIVGASLLGRAISHSQGVTPPRFKYLDALTAKDIDIKLMSTPGFSLDQLMELAGLSVAESAHDFIQNTAIENKKVLIVCGPGNNGGDGLVAARHLYHFGYEPTVVYVKPGRAPIFSNLIQQCVDLGIPIVSSLPPLQSYGIIIDAIFGFSFEGPANAPFSDIISSLSASATPVLSVDVPSGWDVNKGDIHMTKFTPAGVISLTAPKQCMDGYSGVHYLGGRYPSLQYRTIPRPPFTLSFSIRFVPPSLAKEYGLSLPPYSSDKQVCKLIRYK